MQKKFNVTKLVIMSNFMQIFTKNDQTNVS